MSNNADTGPGPREVIGGNNPPLARSISATEGDFALVVTQFLEEEHAKQPIIAKALLDEATALMRDPKTGELLEITDDDMKAKVVSLIKRIRDQAKVFTALHETEKQPYLRGGQAVDQFFFGWIDKLAKRDKKARPGAADVLNQKLTDYDSRKLAEEQARLKREADERARIAREAQERADREAREAEEARAAAVRARKPEIAEEKEQIAKVQERTADAAKVVAVVTTQQAQEAAIAAMAKPADLMRTRGSDGTLSTVGQEKYAEITDRTLLNKELLWPYIKQDAIESALTQWARLTDYNTQMPGAAVGRRNKSQVR